MSLPHAGLYARLRHLGPELVKFCVVGGTGAVIDLGGAAVLHGAYHMGAMGSKALAICAATAVTYLGSRFWTFRHRENQPVLREAVLFIVLNLIGLIIAEMTIAIVNYGLGLQGTLEYNAASVLGTGLGTIFRFYAYRKWVFLAPAAQPGPALVPLSMAEFPPLPDYPPWRPVPAYAAPVPQDYGYPPQEPWHNQFIPNEPGYSPVATVTPPARQAAPRLSAPQASAVRAPGKHRRR